MDKSLIKHLIILSLILGAILGSLTAVPYLGTLTFVIMLLFCAPIVMTYAIMEGLFDFKTYTNSIITGGAIGFCASLSFSTFYAIVITILSYGFHYRSNMFLSAMIINSPIWLLITFIIFIGIVFGATNAFTGLANHYIIDFIRDFYEKKHNKEK